MKTGAKNLLYAALRKRDQERPTNPRKRYRDLEFEESRSKIRQTDDAMDNDFHVFQENARGDQSLTGLHVSGLSSIASDHQAAPDVPDLLPFPSEPRLETMCSNQTEIFPASISHEVGIFNAAPSGAESYLRSEVVLANPIDGWFDLNEPFRLAN